MQNRFDGIYCPQCIVMRKARGLRRRVPTHKPLFPGYVFTVVALAKLRDQDIIGAIYFDGHLARVGDVVIDFIKHKEKRGSYDFTKPGIDAPDVGEIIRPLEGVFAGIRFVFQELMGDKLVLTPLGVGGLSRVIYEGEWEGEGR